MSEFEREVSGVRVPAFLYGTAWKEDDTERLVRSALEAGFRGIDTANQRKHYHEAGVGAAVQKAIADGLVDRSELFLQTKFTHLGGQDHRLPYREEDPVEAQVHQSFASSLEHLGVEAIDSLVLHGPSLRHGLADEDLGAWRAMEEVHRSGGARLLGVSNVSLEQLETLCAEARVQPSFVQNRCYARRGWDAEVRSFCRARGIVYQGFSLLTANVRELAAPSFAGVVERTGLSPAQVVFRFALQVGMLPLTGTTNRAHMDEDLLATAGVALSEEDVRIVEGVGL